MGGMTIAGGIAGALFARERTGEASVVDVSLLSVGAWATALNTNISLLTGEPIPQRGQEREGASRNPIYGQFPTADGRWLQFSMLQPRRYWPEVCRAIGREDLITDERFSTVEDLIEHTKEAGAIVREEIESKTLEQLRPGLEVMDAPWALIQHSLEVANDPALRPNGYVQPITDAEGQARELVASPVQFDETPAVLTRAPQFAEHTDEILREFGYDDERLIEMKIAGAVT